MVFNRAMAPKSSMSNCSWSLRGFQHGLTMGTDTSLVGCLIINPSTNAILGVVIVDYTPATNVVISGNRIISGSAGKGIWAFGSNHTIVGNRITAPTGIQVEGGGSAITGNRIKTGALILQPCVTGNRVLSNTSPFPPTTTP